MANLFAVGVLGGLVAAWGFLDAVWSRGATDRACEAARVVYRELTGPAEAP